MSFYLRGQIAKIANLNIEALRYYEDQGLIPSQARSESGYRLYSEEVLSRLAFIKNAKSCGFTLKEIKKALIESEKGNISLIDFLEVIDQKMGKIQLNIAKQDKILGNLADLKTNLQAANKHPEVKSTLQILHLES